MFFYLSFLRPLPQSSDATSLVSITPQIANDLRTAYLEEIIDVFYAWCSSLLDCASPSVISTTRKLTTWRTSSMYKNLEIPLPPTAKPGQEWRLLLCCRHATQSSSFIIDLSAADLGTYPLPVISMPVVLSKKTGKAKTAGKQEQVERLYSIPPLTDSTKQSTLLCIREQTSFDLDKKIWDSGLGLSSWLTNVVFSAAQIVNPPIQELKDIFNKSNSEPLRIIELGTGTGIVSICLSALLQQVNSSQNSYILATDLPSAIELIDHNIATNNAAYPSVNLMSLVLDWDEDKIPPQALGPIDLIVMADVTYNTASFPSLVRTLDRLVRSSQIAPRGRTPYVLLAYKQRDPEERMLWPMLRDIGVELTSVDDIKGAGTEEVEIWLRSEA